MQFCSVSRRRAATLSAGLAFALCALLTLVASPVAGAATPGTFTTLASSPSPVNNVAVDPTTSLIYAQQNEGTAFYSYDPSTNTWKTLAPSPINQGNNGGGAYLNGKIYTVYTENDTQMGVYDIASNTWTIKPFPLGPQPANSDEGTANITAAGGLLYMAVWQKLVSYNPSTGTVKTLATPPAFSDSNCFDAASGAADNGFQPWGALAYYNGKIYGTQGNGCNGFAAYDIASNTWKELPLVVPTSTDDGPVLGAAIDPVSGTFYTYGGYGEGNFWAFDIATNTWKTLAFPFTHINDGGMAYIATPGLQGIYAVYGQGSTGFTRYNTTAGANVTVKKSASAKVVGVGSKFTYTLHVKNTGASTATGVTVTDKLPARVRFVKATASAGKCKGKTKVTCTVNSLQSGKSATFKITVTAHAGGKATNTAKLSTTSFNLNTKTSSSVSVKITSKQLRLSVTPHSAKAGSQTCYAFHGTSGGKGVGGAKVTLAGHSATTSSSGTATLCLTLKKGSYHARITKSGFSSATAAIRVTAAPSFTG